MSDKEKGKENEEGEGGNEEEDEDEEEAKELENVKSEELLMETLAKVERPGIILLSSS